MPSLSGGNEPRRRVREGAAKRRSENADNVTMKAATHTSLVSNISHISRLLQNDIFENSNRVICRILSLG